MSHVDEGTLNAFLDGELTDPEARRVEEHVGACDACAELLDEAARVRALAGDLVATSRETAGSRPGWDELVARASRPDATEPAATGTPADGGAGAGPLRRWGPALAWAATLVLAFTLGWEASRLGPTPEVTGSDRRPAAEEAPGEPATTTGTAAPAEQEEQERSRPSSPEPSRATSPEPGGRQAARRAVTAPSAPATEQQPREDAATLREPEPEGPEPEPWREGVAATDESPTRPPPAQLRAGGEGAASIGAATSSAADSPFRRIALDDARQWLERRPLELEGAELRSAGLGPPGALPGGLPGRPVLRLRYRDPGTGIDVDVLQQTMAVYTATPAPGVAVPTEDRDRMLASRAESEELASALRRLGLEELADLDSPTLSVEPDGTRVLRWLHPAGYVVALRADADEATLRDLVSRLR